MVLLSLYVIWISLLSASHSDDNEIASSLQHLFHENELLIWVENNGQIFSSSNLSYDDLFLHEIHHLVAIHNVSAIHLDDINSIFYMIYTDEQSTKLIHYDLTKIVAKHLYSWNVKHIAIDNASLLHVEPRSNNLYLSINDVGYRLDLHTLKISRFSIFGSSPSLLNQYKNNLYFLVPDIGILKTKSTNDISNVVLFISNDHVETANITSFVIDASHDVMYFSTNHAVYYLNKITIHTKNDPLVIENMNVNISTSMIYSLQINSDGNMLFIQYNYKNNLYIVNLPTPFVGSNYPKKLFPKRLHNVEILQNSYKRLYYHSKPPQNENSDISSRKLLTEFSNCVTSDLQLPRAFTGGAIGYHNDTIFLLGQDESLVEYIISKNNITDHGAALPTDLYGNSQFYTQIDETLYMIDPLIFAISSYDLNTNVFNYEAFVPIGRTKQCLAGVANNLFVLGGYTHKTTYSNFQIFNISSQEWSSGPDMLYNRHGFTCNVHPITEELYAIAGFETQLTKNPVQRYYRSEIEKINISSIKNITNEAWIQLPQPLFPGYQVRSVVFEDYIFVIGGLYNDNKRIHIQSINCVTGEVTTEAAFLNYGVSKAGAIIANELLYVFGGGGDVENSFQYSTLGPTISP
eukprot:192194_1